MFIAEQHQEMTPTQFTQFLANNPSAGTVVMLCLPSGCLLILIGKGKPASDAFVNFLGLPLMIVPADLTVEQFGQFLENGQQHYAKHGPMDALKAVLELKAWLAKPVPA